jgi:hypothetical protein
MKTCKYCGKTLVGKEKNFCKSCKDQGWDNAKKGAGFLFFFTTIALVVKTKGKDIASFAMSVLKR